MQFSDIVIHEQKTIDLSMIVRRTSTDGPEDTEPMLLGAGAHLDLSHPAADHSRVPLSSYDLLLGELTSTIPLT